MRVLAFMISKMIAVRFLAIVFGLALFVLTLEVVAYVNEILALDDGGLMNVAAYIFYRAPNTLATFLPMSLMLAILLTLTELSYRNEITAIFASGISPKRLILLLVPVALLAGALHVFLIDRAVPWTAPTLRDWGIGDYSEKKLSLGERDPIWMRSGNDILRAATATPDSRQLGDVVIFRRDADGLLTHQVFAETAVLKDGKWMLSNVTTYFRDNRAPERLDNAVYSGTMKPAEAGSRSGDPEEMTFEDLSYFIKNDGFGLRPAYVYETWRQKRVLPLAVALVMVGLCIPLAARFRRGGGLGLLFAAGVGLGFVYFVLDGMSTSLGELGFVPPWMAVWTPVLLFGCVAGFLTFRTEQV
jgi:lipopolysaccharide export system permease protein